MDRLCEWLKQLPKPVGIMACNDVRGQHLLNAASILGLNVPEELAVLGVDNDEVQCQLLNPALSSIKPNAERVGYRGAETLSMLMLSETDLSRERIAHLCGFAHPEYMHVVFKRETGTTPGNFRRDALPGG